MTLVLYCVLILFASLVGGWIPLWGILTQPVAFFVFLTAALAETKRAPFDLPEGESEIIGYFVEYSGMKFGMFYLTDFLETVLVASLAMILLNVLNSTPIDEQASNVDLQPVTSGINPFSNSSL